MINQKLIILFFIIFMLPSCSKSTIYYDGEIRAGRDTKIINCRGDVKIKSAIVKTGRDLYIQGRDGFLLPEKIVSGRDAAFLLASCRDLIDNGLLQMYGD